MASKMQTEKMEKPRRFTRTVCILDRTENTYAGKVSKMMRNPYFIIKAGRSVVTGTAPFPPPRSTVIEVSDECAVAIQDGMDVTYIQLTKETVELCVERWNEYKFETLNPTSNVGRINIGGSDVLGEIKYAKAQSLIKPYTRNASRSSDMPNLPGLTPTDIDVRTHRDEDRKNREEGRARLENALRGANLGASSRLFGVDAAPCIDVPVRTLEIQKPDLGRSQDWNLSFDSNPGSRSMSPLSTHYTGLKKVEPERPSPFIVQEDSLEQDEEPLDVMTSQFIKLNSDFSKAYGTSPMLSSLTQKLACKSMKFEKFVTNVMINSENVPLFAIDQSSGNAVLKGMGECSSAAVVVSGGSYFVLPAGGIDL
uniref:Non-structural protein NS2 n=1 Tax=Equine encephalosis virus TaxID=201490 RepID=A0A891ZU72_9REOV|nr:NS2 protein [Equine encephalosis virus]